MYSIIFHVGNWHSMHMDLFRYISIFLHFVYSNERMQNYKFQATTNQIHSILDWHSHQPSKAENSLWFKTDLFLENQDVHTTANRCSTASISILKSLYVINRGCLVIQTLQSTWFTLFGLSWDKVNQNNEINRSLEINPTFL